jgi:hypothetical protein
MLFKNTISSERGNIMSKEAVIITKNYTNLDHREVVAIFNIDNTLNVSVGLDILENKYEQCDRVHLTRSEVRELYLKLKEIYE